MTESETFETLRPLLFSIAYRMLGSVSEAEDIVQDAFVRYQRALDEGGRIESLKAYLSAMVTRLVIDHLRSARARRETYVGQWLPAPILTDDGRQAANVERADSLSMAFLLTLQRLSPTERAVFLLHDVFDYSYAEIAEIVGKTEDNCRQVALRARKHIEAAKPRFEISAEKRDDLSRRFFAAISGGDSDALVRMLANDAVVYGDGGGKAPQWSKPITGADRVAKLLAGLGAKLRAHGGHVIQREINGQPGAMLVDHEDRLISVFALDVADGRVQAVRSVINPDKLRHLGPLADLDMLLERSN
ncbi:MAG: sigma-70 family RNA polymerase sigma factor [Polyangiaceae bacterium]|nr:sigma-70 family RNA polymerase sigma factor [Polyangiaceae bacterium]